MFTTSLVRTNKLIDLFQSGQKSKKEPKVSVLLSTLSAVLLIVSYYLAATATMGNLNYRMLPVIGMTIVGTYFFYTQLSVFILKVLQKNKMLFWKRTNLITISNLTYRLKDNARMFFVVKIVSAVAFCAVGALASVHALNKQIKMNFPAAISYVAKNHQPFQTQNLKEIVDDIEKKNLKYTKLSIPIKMVKIFKEPKGISPDALPVISFSSYKRLVGKAGLDIHEPHLTGEKILGMNTNNTSRKVTYTLKQNRMNLKQNQLAKQVVIPGEVIGYQGIIVSDDLYKSLSADAGTFQYTGFFISDPEKSEGVGDHLVNSGSMPSYAKAPYAMVVSGDILKMQKGLFSTMLFVALLIGTVFFIAAGSFLYFRLYADLDYDRRQYLTITKVGLTEKELNRIVTQQLLLLFFIPIIVAFIHSAFAFKALQSFYSASIFSDMLLVLGCFLAAQVLYFFFPISLFDELETVTHLKFRLCSSCLLISAPGARFLAGGSGASPCFLACGVSLNPLF
jgi:putative ABC transport system permease protein